MKTFAELGFPGNGRGFYPGGQMWAQQNAQTHRGEWDCVGGASSAPGRLVWALVTASRAVLLLIGF